MFFHYLEQHQVTLCYTEEKANIWPKEEVRSGKGTQDLILPLLDLERKQSEFGSALSPIPLFSVHLTSLELLPPMRHPGPYWSPLQHSTHVCLSRQGLNLQNSLFSPLSILPLNSLGWSSWLGTLRAVPEESVARLIQTKVLETGNQSLC